jgi:hypothetical protein
MKKFIEIDDCLLYQKAILYPLDHTHENYKKTHTDFGNIESMCRLFEPDSIDWKFINERKDKKLTKVKKGEQVVFIIKLFNQKTFQFFCHVETNLFLITKIRKILLKTKQRTYFLIYNKTKI